MAATAHPGSSWRVGVIDVTNNKDDEDGIKSAWKIGAEKVDMNAPKPAILHVGTLDPEANDGATAVVRLWRPDMLTGIIEVGAQQSMRPLNDPFPCRMDPT